MFTPRDIQHAERIERKVKLVIRLLVVVAVIAPMWWYYHKSTTDLAWMTAPPKDTEFAEYIETPSGNIFCQLTDDFVGCTIYNREYEANGQEDCPGEHFSYVLQKGARLPEMQCDAAFIGLDEYREKLKYGDYVQSHKFVCQSTKEHLSCWEKETGYGLKLSKRFYEGTSFLDD